MPKVYVLYGVAARDKTELVCMFFRTRKDRAAFARALPGKYQRLTMVGVGYDDFDIQEEK